jgi:hypothetical protein
MILVFRGDMYVEYYNSFYMDTAAVLFLFMAGVLFLRACYLHGSRAAAMLSLICCCLFALAKGQHALLGIPPALLSASTGAVLWPSHPALSRSFAAVLILVCSMVEFLSTSPEYYLGRPQRMAFILKSRLDAAGIQRPLAYGNFDKSAGRPPTLKRNYFALWSAIKREVN